MLMKKTATNVTKSQRRDQADSSATMMILTTNDNNKIMTKNKQNDSMMTPGLISGSAKLPFLSPKT